jgi:hypothetical protein
MRNLAAQLLSSGIALPMASVFETFELSRATHYRHQASDPPLDPDLELRDHIQRLALEWPQYG